VSDELFELRRPIKSYRDRGLYRRFEYALLSFTQVEYKRRRWKVVSLTLEFVPRATLSFTAKLAKVAS